MSDETRIYKFDAATPISYMDERGGTRSATIYSVMCNDERVFIHTGADGKALADFLAESGASNTWLRSSSSPTNDRVRAPGDSLNSMETADFPAGAGLEGAYGEFCISFPYKSAHPGVDADGMDEFLTLLNPEGANRRRPDVQALFRGEGKRVMEARPPSVTVRILRKEASAGIGHGM